MSNVPAKRVSSFEELKEKGDIYWEFAAIDNRPVRVWFVCVNCGKQHQAPVKGWDPNGWDFNGNLDKPTLTPSIWMNKDHPHASCRWHGYLTNGEFSTL